MRFAVGKISKIFIICKVFKNTRQGPLNPIYKRFKRQQLQIDLLELRNISKENKGMNFLLTIIDSYTKFAWAVPLPNKEKSTVLEGFKSVISKLDDKPLNIISDLGTILLPTRGYWRIHPSSFRGCGSASSALRACRAIATASQDSGCILQYPLVGRR